jgi:hypothetical protein
LGPGLLGAESSGALDVLRPDPADRILRTDAWCGCSGREPRDATRDRKLLRV